MRPIIRRVFNPCPNWCTVPHETADWGLMPGVRLHCSDNLGPRDSRASIHLMLNEDANEPNRYGTGVELAVEGEVHFTDPDAARDLGQSIVLAAARLADEIARL